MPELIPQYVIEQANKGQDYHSFAATALFVDLSGFSAITSALMVHGNEAAELMATIMEAIFTPLVDAVYEHAGFITTFAGDAFTAVFPHHPHGAHQACCHALVAAMAIRQHFWDNPSYETGYGRFAFTAKVGLGMGQVNCGIIRPANPDQQADGNTSYYFNGSAIEQAIGAETVATGGEILLSTAVAEIVADVGQSEPLPQTAYHRFVANQRPLPPAQPAPTPASVADQRPFVPDIIWPHIHQGDFRQVITVFIQLQQVETHQQLATFMHTLFALQAQYSGYLATLEFGDKGCTLLLYWGTPISYENDLSRTLSFLVDLSEQSLLPFSAGVTYQHMYTGLTGSARRATFSCYGNGVNLAARLMAAAPSGAIWLEGSTARRVSHSFILTDAGTHSFKGFSDPITVYAVNGRRSASEDELYQGKTVGRSKERQQLQTFLQAALRGPDKPSHVITAVIGEAGLGKSRLVYETVTDSARTLSAQYWFAQTDEILRQPFNPFQYWLRRYFKQASDQSEAENKQQFAERLDQLRASMTDPDEAENLARLFSVLAALVDLHWPDSLYAELDPQSRHESSLIVLQKLIRAECERQPFVLVVEDAHALDPSSHELLIELGRNLHDLPFAVVMTSRPRRNNNWPLASIPHQPLNLFALPDEEVAQMCQAVLYAPADEALQELIISRAEGNPFFAEQILRYLQENQAIQMVDGVWALLHQGQTSKLPDDLRLLFIARLDRLEQSVREGVEMAAVLGREFDVRLLGQMLQDTSRVPYTLVRAENEAIWLSLSQIRYMFRHLLLRDAAYEMQLLARRRQLHWLAAVSLEKVYATDLSAHYAEISYHYETAYKQGLAEAREGALRYLRLTGEQAAARYENWTAVEIFTRALALEETAVGQVGLLLQREDIYHLLVEREAQAADLQQLSALTADLPNEAAVVAFRRARLATAKNQVEDELILSQTAVEIAQKVGNPVLESDAHANFGYSLMERGEFNQARTHYQQALALARQTGSVRQEIAALIGLGSTAAQQTELEAAATYWQEAWPLAQQMGEHRQEASIFNNLGNIALLRNEYKTALAYYKQALALRQTMGDRSAELTTLDNLGNVYRQMKEYVTARQMYEKALALIEATGYENKRADIYIGLGILAKNLGDYDMARYYYELVLELSSKMGHRVTVGATHHNLGALAKVYGDYAYAQEQSLIALAIFREVGDRYGEWLTLYELGDVALILGQYEESKGYYEHALAIQQQIGHQKGMASALTKFGHLLVAQEAWGEAEAMLQQALVAHEAVKSEEGWRQTAVLLARLYLAQGQTAVALAQVETLLPTLAAEDAQLERVQDYFVAYQLLQALARFDEAALFLQKARQTLEAVTVNIKEEKTRQTFFNAVPVHQQIMAA